MGFSSKLSAVLLGLALFMPLSAARADDCDKATDGQAGLNECSGSVFKKADGEPNKLYKEIERRLKGDPDTTKLLATAQKAWVACRDGECDFETAGGSNNAGMSYPICQIAITQSRIDDFRDYLKCQEGDTNCPVPAAE